MLGRERTKQIEAIDEINKSEVQISSLVPRVNQSLYCQELYIRGSLQDLPTAGKSAPHVQWMLDKGTVSLGCRVAEAHEGLVDNRRRAKFVGYLAQIGKSKDCLRRRLWRLVVVVGVL